MSEANRIGIMDWGIGGLSIYQALRAAGNLADVTYLSDSGSTPYGKQDRTSLRARFGEIAAFFRAHDVERVLVACNSASSAVDGAGESFAGVRFESIIPAGIRAIDSSAKRRFGVIGGNLTIASKVYENQLRHPGKKFFFAPAQPLSALVERGELTGAAVEREVREVLERLAGIDSLLLACTHYPALSPAFREQAPDLELLDPADRMVENLPRGGQGRLLFFTTGSGDLSMRAARGGFSVELGQAHELRADLRPK